MGIFVPAHDEKSMRCLSLPRLSHQTVADVLWRWSAAMLVFYRLRMACVGCDMAEFEPVARRRRAMG
ncbi:MAG: hypothetical protein GEV06_18655 [Luteitalea sp.]|nr:hypothetical protein [Luteitalea sp.]